MPVILTPEIAARMLDIWERRLKTRGPYDTSLLEAALHDLPDTFPVRRGANLEKRWVKELPGGKWRRVS